MQDPVQESLEALSKASHELESKLDALSRPVRDNAFKRFPIFFSLLVAFGGAAVLFGFEQLLLRIPFFANNPLMILLLGIFILMLTGTLYKKL